MTYNVMDAGTVIDLRRGAGQRSSGVHLSQIVRHVAVKMRYLEQDDDDQPEDINQWPLVQRLRMAMGLAWEEYYGQFYPTVLFHPGEVVMDDIAGSPDGVEPDAAGGPILHEFKVTWKSRRRILEALDDHNGGKCNWMWLTQCKAYCHMLGYSKVRLHVYTVNGDYKPPAPALDVIAMEVSRAELAANWRLMMQYRGEVEPEQHG